MPPQLPHAANAQPKDPGLSNLPTPSTSPPIPIPDPNAAPPEIQIDEDTAWLNVLEIDGLKDKLNVCVERWKSASPEARKKMFALFAIAGVFVAICRHGHVLLVCDMIRSGEL
jgi:hypothetical protein